MPTQVDDKAKVLVVDVGSSSVRALLFDKDARLVPGAIASREHAFTTVPAGAATADTANLRALTEACIDDVLQHPAAQCIVAAGMATFAGNVLGIDDGRNALTPVYTYADTRSSDDVRTLQGQISLTETHQRTGCMHHTAYQPARLHWLRRTQPKLFAQVTRWVDFGTYLYQHWFGTTVPVSYSIASWSGLLNRENLTWDQDWLNVLGLDARLLPPLADYSSAQSGLVPEYAERWPALKEVPFYLAVGDGAAANIGLGAVDSGHLALTVGTTAALRVVVSSDDLPPVPDGLWAYRVDAERHLIGGATTEGGNIFHWAQTVLQLPDNQSTEVELAIRKPDSHGLTFVPLLAGERSPGWAADATGTVTGLRLSTTPLDVLQAALEGVALRLALISNELVTSLNADVKVVAGGGALSSRAWAQIIANALNRPLTITSEQESTARGAAILVLCAIGLASLDDFAVSDLPTVYPDPEAVSVLRNALQRQSALYDATVPKAE